MFCYESQYNDYKSVYGKANAAKILLDVENVKKTTAIFLGGTSRDNYKKVSNCFLSEREVIDFNQHFIELSSRQGGAPRSLSFLMLISILVIICFALFIIYLTFIVFTIGWAVIISLGFSVFAFFMIYVFWVDMIKDSLFTALCARYRFNRTARKVYVLRPKRYGGNVILDWDRVNAHVNWTLPDSDATPQAFNDPKARAERAEHGRQEQNLLLYWPPLDENDPERKGEDVIWVGSKGAGQRLWNYICTYMEKGMDAVAFPGPDAWLRKGFSGASEHLEESVMHRSHQLDDAKGQGTSTGTYINYALNMPWAPLNSLAERLCYWPTFPKEWNSDCGQTRRESGIGPEEPLRWEAKP